MGSESKAPCRHSSETSAKKAGNWRSCYHTTSLLTKKKRKHLAVDLFSEKKKRKERKKNVRSNPPDQKNNMSSTDKGAGSGSDPFARNDDGTALDPRAFQKAIRDDPVRLEEASKDPQVAKVLLGDDMNALQELLRAYHLAEKRRRADMAHRSTDAQRVSATVPRDSVAVYDALHKAGSQYGPAFQLLTNIHVPDTGM